jgi:hypothetical protein
MSRKRALAEHPRLPARAAELLRTPQAMLPLSAEEAACVVAQMVLVYYPPRATVLREGDGAPRSATCVAVSAVQAAGLSRQGLERLVEQHPEVAAKLMIALPTRISDRLRAMADHLRVYARLSGRQ